MVEAPNTAVESASVARSPDQFARVDLRRRTVDGRGVEMIGAPDKDSNL
jgi:hypothetical protein